MKVLKSVLVVVALSLLMGLPFGIGLSRDANSGAAKAGIPVNASGWETTYNAQFSVFCATRNEAVSCVYVRA